MKDFFCTTLTVGKATEIMWMLSGSLCIIPLYYEQIYCRLLAKRHHRRSIDVNQRESHWTVLICRSCLRIKIRLSYDSEEGCDRWLQFISRTRLIKFTLQCFSAPREGFWLCPVQSPCLLQTIFYHFLMFKIQSGLERGVNYQGVEWIFNSFPPP